MDPSRKRSQADEAAKKANRGRLLRLSAGHEKPRRSVEEVACIGCIQWNASQKAVRSDNGHLIIVVSCCFTRKLQHGLSGGTKRGAPRNLIYHDSQYGVECSLVWADWKEARSGAAAAARCSSSIALILWHCDGMSHRPSRHRRRFSPLSIAKLAGTSPSLRQSHPQQDPPHAAQDENGLASIIAAGRHRSMTSRPGGTNGPLT